MAKITRLRDLTPDAKNANKGTERGTGMLEQSLRNYGAGRSILIDAKGRIIAGNKTVQEAGAIGMDKVQVVESDGSTIIAVQRTDLDLERDPKARELALADNRIAEVNLDYDKAVLADLAGDINIGQFFLENELKDLLEPDEAELLEPDEAEQAETQADVAKAEELAEKWHTAPGQLWQIGPHRALCGDSTNREDFDRLMAGVKAQLVVTDPPYGVSYRNDVIVGDDKRDDALLMMLTAVLRLASTHTTPQAAFYIWHASRTRRDFEDAMRAAALEEKQYITWVKDCFVMGHADYHWQSEPCFYAQKCGQRATFYGDRAQSTAWFVGTRDQAGRQSILLGNGVRISNGRGQELFIQERAPKQKKVRLVRLASNEDAIISTEDGSTDLWRVSHEGGTAMHPTQKPTELATRAIRNSTNPGEVVLDPFLGAGFAMVGAHKIGRACFGLELDPKYLAVVLERMAGMNLQPELIDDEKRQPRTRKPAASLA